MILKNKINEISRSDGVFSSKMTNFAEEIQISNIMKKINIFLVFFLTFSGVYAQDSQNEKTAKTTMSTFGQQIDQNNVISSQEMSKKYAQLAVSDTISSKFSGTVTEVCQSKGCWMKVQLENGNETMVRFKNYGFFMPKDIQGKEVIVKGSAFVEEMSVADQQHYAKDAGKSENELRQIKTPKRSFGFTADGVLLKE